MARSVKDDHVYDSQQFHFAWKGYNYGAVGLGPNILRKGMPLGGDGQAKGCEGPDIIGNLVYFFGCTVCSSLPKDAVDDELGHVCISVDVGGRAVYDFQHVSYLL